jgi:hypothetical protein
MRALIAAVLLVGTLTLPAQEKPKPAAKDRPAIRYPVPLIAPPGKKTKLTLRGARLDAVTELRTDTPGAAVTLVGKGKAAAVPNTHPKEKVGDTEADLELDVPADFAGDHVAVVAVSPAGASEPYPLAVGKPGTPEGEPNDGFDTAQVVTLPATIDGSVGKEKDADVFRFAGKKGQTVKVEVAAAERGSPADLLLTVYDATRRSLVVVDDVGGKPDPAVTLALPADGDYYLSLIEAHDLGGAMYGYRMTIK